MFKQLVAAIVGPNLKYEAPIVGPNLKYEAPIVGPNLKYEAPIWNHHSKEQIILIRNVQEMVER